MTGDRSVSGAHLDVDPAIVPDYPIVDAHVHVFPQRVLESISEWFAREQSWSIPAPPLRTVVDRIDRRTDGFVLFPYAHEPDVSRSMNHVVAKWKSELDDVVALGTVHAGDDDPGAVVAELFERGLRGVKLHSPVQEFTVDDDRLDPVYEHLVSRDAPLVAHVSSHPFYRGSPGLGPAPLRRVLERFPGLRVCVPHLGLFETRGFLDLAEQYDLYFDTSVALGPGTRDAVGVRSSDLPEDRLLDVADRAMFGTDYPIRPLSYGQAFRGISSTFPGHEADVFYRNAQRFFQTDFGISE